MAIGNRAFRGSGFRPPEPDQTFGGTNLYVPKKDDWRYYQGLTFTYSPKWIDGLSLGFIRWVQMYGEFATTYRDYFPVFDGLFRKNDKWLFDGSLEWSKEIRRREFLEGGFGRMLKPKFTVNKL